MSFEDKGLLNNRRVFKQNKTDAIVAIRTTEILDNRLKASAERRKKAGVISSRLILDEKNWKPFNKRHYHSIFEQVKKAAIEGNSNANLKPCPSLATLRDQDLRDTSVTWQALAGATIPQIISVTGHSLQSATKILQHYLAKHPEMADRAIGLMEAWYKAGGKTETGL